MGFYIVRAASFLLVLLSGRELQYADVACSGATGWIGAFRSGIRRHHRPLVGGGYRRHATSIAEIIRAAAITYEPYEPYEPHEPHKRGPCSGSLRATTSCCNAIASPPMPRNGVDRLALH